MPTVHLETMSQRGATAIASSQRGATAIASSQRGATAIRPYNPLEWFRLAKIESIKAESNKRYKGDIKTIKGRIKTKLQRY